ncbi:MAG TPA: hypothetical protein VN578_04360 [Candidatus Binatia bacterium]|jgi:hypothetical protein|nr:hypothetical protein [Candidatus Binatia bacterium]
MNRAMCFLAVCGLALGGAEGSAAKETKTAPARDVFVEQTATDFDMAAKVSPPDRDLVVSFDLSGPKVGKYTLVCFIDGRIFKQEPFNLPGTFKLSVRGMEKGTHKVTLQLVDAGGNVGSITKKIQRP